MSKENTKLTEGLLKELAEKEGYDLVRKKSTEGKIFPGDVKKYEKMDSKKLGMELNSIEAEIKKRLAGQQKIKDKVVKFMNNQGPNFGTRAVYNNNTFESGDLQLRDLRLVKLQNLKERLEQLLTKKLEKETRRNLVSVYPELENKVDDIGVESTPTGKVLKVDLKEGDINRPEEEKQKTEGEATTSENAVSGKE